MTAALVALGREWRDSRYPPELAAADISTFRLEKISTDNFQFAVWPPGEGIGFLVDSTILVTAADDGGTRLDVTTRLSPSLGTAITYGSGIVLALVTVVTRSLPTLSGAAGIIGALSVVTTASYFYSADWSHTAHGALKSLLRRIAREAAVEGGS